MTDRARLTVERVEQIREYALAGKVDTILVQEQECVALCDHALAALRRESAAPDEPSEADLDRGCANATERMEAIKAKRAAPDGGLSGSEIENIKLHYFGREGDQSADGMDISTVRKLCNMALRSLERPAGPTTNQLPIEHQISSSAPACRVVPEEPTEDMIAPGEALIQGVIECVQKDRWFDTFATARNIYKAMLAAAPPSGERKEEE